MRNISELLENALVLVPIAILVFVRVFAKVLIDKKKRKRVESKARPTRQTPARKALDRLSQFMTGSLEQALVVQEPLDFELTQKRRYESPQSTTQAILSQEPRRAALSTLMATDVREASANAQMPGGSPTGGSLFTAVASPRVAASAVASTRSFPHAVERLSPLKQAFVFSAILGKPRYFDY